MVNLSEKAWATCQDDPALLLERLGYSGWHTARKFRLFCCAAARRILPLIDLDGERLVRVAERAADGECGADELAAAIAEVDGYIDQSAPAPKVSWEVEPHRWNAAYAPLLALTPERRANERRSSVCIARLETWPVGAPPDERSARVELVRDIFDDPFRPAGRRIDPRRLSGTAVALARGIAADQAFDRLPILADALEESGCDDPAVLAHCRGRSSHVRGCWAVDLMLGLGVALPAEPGASVPSSRSRDPGVSQLPGAGQP